MPKLTLTDAIKAGHKATVVGKSIEVRTEDGRLMFRLWYPRPTTAQMGLRAAHIFAARECA